MKNKYKSSRGFALGEVIIALAVVSVISLASVSLFTSSVNATKRAIDRAEAQNVLESVIECYRVTDIGENFDSNFNSALAFALDVPSVDYTAGISKDNMTVRIAIDGNEISVSVYTDGQNASADEPTVTATYYKGGEVQ